MAKSLVELTFPIPSNEWGAVRACLYDREMDYGIIGYDKVGLTIIGARIEIPNTNDAVMFKLAWVNG